MERIPENKILKFNPDTMVSLRKLYNLDKPGQMDEAIDLLDAWIKKQNHFTRKDFPREYLERVIMQLKGSVERAKGQMDKICTLRTLLPRYFEKGDAIKDYKILNGYATITLLPKLTKDNIRVFFGKYEPQRYSPKVFFHIFTLIVLIAEYQKAHDYSNGLTIISDLRDVSIIEFVAQMNLVELKEIFTIFLEGFDVRVQNFLFITTSKVIDVLIKILRSMISEKLGKRIHILQTVEELHEHISKELLPSDYGGDEKPLAQLADDFMKELGNEDFVKYFKDMSNVKTIESLRISSQYNGDFTGLAGTFRTLSVD